MKRVDIAQRMDEIVEFAGVGDFVDTQVKRYSSGMNARLGFSIAAHLDPDVLIIDEVLSVGDMAFQDRCVERMQDFRKRGVTIVFVSHNLQAVASLCPTALFLKGGLQALGDTSGVIAKYIKETVLTQKASANDDVELTSPRLLTSDGRPVETVSPGDRLALEVTYTSKVPLNDFEFGFVVQRSTDGVLVHAQGIPCDRVGVPALRPGQPVRVQFDFHAHLTRGHYYIECHAFHKPTQRHIGYLRPAALFSVEENDVWGGVAHLEVSCHPIQQSVIDVSEIDPARAVMGQHAGVASVMVP
jgi:energy-coupling factor transporter ATP-binding protein EcfA2